MDASLGRILSKLVKAQNARRRGAGTRPDNERWRAFSCPCPRTWSVSLIWYVKHRLRDGSVETFRCDTEARAHVIPPRPERGERSRVGRGRGRPDRQGSGPRSVAGPDAWGSALHELTPKAIHDREHGYRDHRDQRRGVSGHGALNESGSSSVPFSCPAPLPGAGETGIL